MTKGYYYYRLIEKICEHYHAFRIMETPVGYKLINVGLFKSPHPSSVGINNDTITINPADLFLSIDFLKDKYTLLGCNIIDSPHWGLMEAIDKGKDVKDTDYIKRFYSGTLDARYPRKVSDVSFFNRTYRIMKEKLENEVVEPIFVYKVGDSYYIKDGKHRAALCAYFGKPINGVVLDNSSMVGYIGRTVANLISTNPEYSKHIEMYKKIQL